MTARTDTVLIGRVAGPVRTRYRTRPWQRRWHRLTHSAFAADVRRGLDRALTILGAFGVAYTLLILLRGAQYAAHLTGIAQ